MLQNTEKPHYTPQDTYSLWILIRQNAQCPSLACGSPLLLEMKETDMAIEKWTRDDKCSLSIESALLALEVLS